VLRASAGGKIPDTIPDMVGSAAEMWLALARQRMAKESLRVVPSKIRKYVVEVGADTALGDVAKTWPKWLAWLDKCHLAPTTRRVFGNRVLELVHWLVAEGRVREFV
jgi:hypothetical protein